VAVTPPPKHQLQSTAQAASRFYALQQVKRDKIEKILDNLVAKNAGFRLLRENLTLPGTFSIDAVGAVG
jgi:hypothetical protein